MGKAKGASKFAIPIAEIVGGYFSGNSAMMADGAQKGVRATQTGKAEKGGTYGGQRDQFRNNPVGTGMMLYGSGSGNGSGEGGMGSGGGGTDWGSIIGGIGDMVGSNSTTQTPTDNGTGDQGTDWGSIISGGTSIIGGLTDILNKRDREKQIKDADRKWDAQNTDLQQRREATYRRNEAIIMDALGQYYGKTGMNSDALNKETLPGAGTSYRLPTDTPLYTEEAQKATDNGADAGQMRPLKPLAVEDTTPTDGSIMFKPYTSQQDKQNQATSGQPKVAEPSQPQQLAAEDTIYEMLKRRSQR